MTPSGSSTRCGDDEPVVRWLGLWGSWFVSAAIAPLALTMLLFLGPLVTTCLDGYKPLLRPHGELARLKRIRNLLVGPLAEEWVFRGCMCPLLYGAGFSDGASVFISAIVFGSAHIHHRFDAGGDPWTAVAVQFTYTSLFGAYSSYLFLRTGLLIGPVLAHTFCNHMGLPDFGGVATHAHAIIVASAYVAGLIGFIVLVTLDAIYRPKLFGSFFWE
eukprot:CAMPEP_0181186550 /NCGR_PEP_ID=MMETSP1096-20121128/10095_1 /TAXON_ID=156174 ORGANISM="Chrysochromulina ericina, Strain CCMP281" /NCGR_SAMPLE_ID=MMETSP1096 /ASSEMBLY_ACC=CAM_ASM_000453 /LENGTH=215 /DNA_ID=CAMNT_0023275457 /DNA_START=140 /DNA_END=788 /DNA_ORIENTATION=+